MTVIEFFTTSPLENMISCFSLKPDKVIFVGAGDYMLRMVPIFRDVASGLKLNTEIVYEDTGDGSIASICSILERLVKSEGKCCFDLTGGDDLALVAMGIIYQKHKDVYNLQMQRFDIKTGKLTDCITNKEKPSIYGEVRLTAKQYIELHGGKIKKSNVYNLSFKDDVERLWEVCRKKPKAWNSLINLLGRSKNNNKKGEDVYRVDINKKLCNQPSVGLRLDELKNALSLLSAKGLITDFKEDSSIITFNYKNTVVKRCLTKAGDILEFFVLTAASMVKNEDGTPRYNDYISNVEIDWDGKYGKGYFIDGPMNEIDVFAINGLLPVFISCKNGSVEEDEMYKLSTVSDRFGGVYGKRVMVLSALNKDGRSKAFFNQRAEEMGIIIIDDVSACTLEALAERLSKI